MCATLISDCMMHRNCAINKVQFNEQIIVRDNKIINISSSFVSIFLRSCISKAAVCVLCIVDCK